jgi:hypothetical protein
MSPISLVICTIHKHEGSLPVDCKIFSQVFHNLTDLYLQRMIFPFGQVLFIFVSVRFFLSRKWVYFICYHDCLIISACVLDLRKTFHGF